MAGQLGWPAERIFDLLPRELPAAARQPQRHLRIAERRAGERQLARRAAREGRLPAVILASRVERIGAIAEFAATDHWQGTALSPGRCSGIARVVDADDALPRLTGNGDEILVLRAANLGIAPLLRMVAGVVVEVGGLLAHSACQAREAGIPAIALPGATRLIADGAAIAIDGHGGQVALIHPDGQGKRDERESATV